jgi:uncharacterized protein
MNPEESLLEFPCDFPLKVVGRAREDFDALVTAIVRRHIAGLASDAVTARTSREGRYVSLTVTVRAESRAQLDALYTELSGHADILLVL